MLIKHTCLLIFLMIKRHYKLQFPIDNYLLAIDNKDLCSFDSIGNISRIIKLPGEEMRICAGKLVMYVYDQDKKKPGKSLFLLAKGGTYAKLFEITTSINSVIEIEKSILFASENGLFSFDLVHKEFKPLIALPGKSDIISIAADSKSNKIYFSTDSKIFALEDSKIVMITDQFGGILKYFSDGLLVFNPEKKFLIRIVGLEGKITSKIQELKNGLPEKQADNILTNAKVIDLVKSKLSDGLIIKLINRSEVDFNLSIDSMIYLSGQQVSSAVILAMKNAMKLKNSKNLNETKPY